MDWGPIWPIDNFKGHKVKKKMALAGLGAPSETTFEPIEINMSNFGNQCILANPILTWKEKKIRTKKLAKFWAKNFSNSKSQTKCHKCMENHARDFLWLFSWLWQNPGNWDFAKQSTINQKIPWHDFPCMCDILFDFLRLKSFDPKFSQVWPNLAKFFGPIFFLSH